MADWGGDRAATLCVRTPPDCTNTATLAAAFLPRKVTGLTLRAKRGQLDARTGLRGGIAFVVFESAQVAAAALAQYDGCCGPAAKAFQIGAEAEGVGGTSESAAASSLDMPGGWGWEPSTRSQLAPLTLAQLRVRGETLCERVGGSSVQAVEQLRAVGEAVDAAIERSGVVAGQQLLLDHICGVYLASPRPKRLARGAHIPDHLCDELLRALRATDWDTVVKGRRLDADEYLTLRVPWAGASRRRRNRMQRLLETHDAVWQAAARVMEAVAPNQYEYTSLAVTRNFRGSPHRDVLDQSYQFALSLGTFAEAGEGGAGGAGSAGGRLCVETKRGREITCIDTYRRLGCIDGRFTHWVDGYEGERFSVVFYTVDPQHKTPLVDPLPLPAFSALLGGGAAAAVVQATGEGAALAVVVPAVATIEALAEDSIITVASFLTPRDIAFGGSACRHLRRSMVLMLHTLNLSVPPFARLPVPTDPMAVVCVEGEGQGADVGASVGVGAGRGFDDCGGGILPVPPGGFVVVDWSEETFSLSRCVTCLRRRLGQHPPELYMVGGAAPGGSCLDTLWVLEPQLGRGGDRLEEGKSKEDSGPLAAGGGGTPSRWRKERATMRTVRRSHAVAVLGGKLYAMGGYGLSRNTLRSVEAFDPSTGEWEPRPFMRRARSGFGAAVLGGKLYVFGGASLGFIGSSREMERFTPTPYTEPAASGDANANANAGGGDGHDGDGGGDRNSRPCGSGGDVGKRDVGGVGDGGGYGNNSDEEDEGGVWEAMPSLGRSRAFHGAAVLCGRIWAVGGRGPQGFLDDVESFGPTPREVRGEVGGADEEDSKGGASDQGGTGEDDEGEEGEEGDEGSEEGAASNEAKSKSKANCTQIEGEVLRWRREPAMPTKRGGAGVGVFGDRMYVVGGHGPDGSILRSMIMFDSRWGTWSEGPPMATARWCTAVAVMEDPRGNWGREGRWFPLEGPRPLMFVVGGRGDDNMIVPEEDAVEVFDLIAGKWLGRDAARAAGAAIPGGARCNLGLAVM